ncbi:putative chromatin regulator PHD family protein [Tanacetum coccineum]
MRELEATGEHTTAEINAMVRGGKLRGHIPGVGPVMPGYVRSRLSYTAPVDRSRDVDFMMSLMRSDNRFADAFARYDSGGASGSGGSRARDREDGDDTGGEDGGDDTNSFSQRTVAGKNSAKGQRTIEDEKRFDKLQTLRDFPQRLSLGKLNMQLTKVEGRVQNIMEFKEVSIKEIQHEHPLFPEDLQLIYINYDEGDDDFDDSELIEKQKFNCVCNMCGLGIDWYHRICEREIFNEYWLYKCSKCMFYVHLDCATQDRQLLPDYEPLEKHSSDDQTPCNFPLPDEAYNILPSQVREWKTSRYFDQTQNQNSHLTHFSHKHPLELKISNLDSTSLHNPMKRVKLICNGCVRPITAMPFYKCSEENECPNFVLHEWCARLRTEVQVDPHIHPHRLTLGQRDSLFCCNICSLPCNGFAYGCGTCRYYIDVNCALVPYYIIHEAHPLHKLMRVVTSGSSNMSIEKLHACHACRNIIDRGNIFYKCGVPGCDFSLDQLCALRLPKTVRHKIDKHIMKLSYSPIENHRGEYFCEVCEEELNPHKWFYHCSECAYSIHSNCAPLILQSEQDVNSSYEELVYRFVNMKFDSVHNIGDHAHSVTFVAGTKIDGKCTKCRQELQSKVIFRCLQCKFAIHNYCESSITDQVKEELVEMFDNLEKKREPKIKPQPQRVVTFFPKKLTRPVTR